MHKEESPDGRNDPASSGNDVPRIGSLVYTKEEFFELMRLSNMADAVSSEIEGTENEEQGHSHETKEKNACQVDQ